MANWTVGAARDLPIATDETWDGGSAAASIFEWAGGENFSAAKAKRGFLVHDASAPDLRGSYKLPFAIVSGGTLKASPAGIRAAASRLPQTDGLSSETKASAQAVIAGYERRMHIGDHAQQDGAPAGVQRKMLGCLTKMAPAQPADLDLIKQYIQPGAEIAPEDVLIASGLLAHDQYDRSHERFPKAYLDRFAETIPGRALMEGHDYSKRPSGRWFDAEVRQHGNGYGLFGKFYVDAKSDMAREIQLGIAKELSIGYIPDSLMCDLCGKDAHREHQPGQQYDGKTCTLTYGGDVAKVEGVEGSVVWLPCQPGAQVMGQSSPLYRSKMALAAAAQEGDSMELKEALAEIDRLKAELAASEKHQKAAERYEAFLRAEIGRKTKAKELAASRDEKAAERAAAFVAKMSAGAGVEQLEEMSTDLDEQLKTVLTPTGKAEGAGHVKVDDEPARKVPFGPQRRAMI